MAFTAIRVVQRIIPSLVYKRRFFYFISRLHIELRGGYYGLQKEGCKVN